jgi:hypothetical protein
MDENMKRLQPPPLLNFETITKLILKKSVGHGGKEVSGHIIVRIFGNLNGPLTL